MFKSVYIIFFIGVSFLPVQALSPCPLVLSIDISNGTLLPNSSSIIFDDLVFPVESQFSFENTTRGCVCDIKPCIRKCCPDGESFSENGCRTNPNAPSLTFHRHTEPIVNNSAPDLYTIYNYECMDSIPDLLLPNQIQFYIQEDGTLYLLGKNASIVSQDGFCYEYFDFEDIPGYFSVIICSKKSPISEDSDYFYDYLYDIGIIISMPFLLATFIVYALLPERNIQGECLMFYVITLFGAYVILVTIQLIETRLNYSVCIFLALVRLYFFMISFFWMNVISIDIWWTFSGMRRRSESKTESKQQKFIIYCSYSWCAPLFMIILVVSLTFSKNIPYTAGYHPGIGEYYCWFQEGIPTFIYFYLPMSTIVIANAIFFAITFYNIKQIQRNTLLLKNHESKTHSYENNKQMFNLYLKLFLAMVANWSMEIISWAINWQVENSPTAIYLSEIFKAIYGIFIFFLFVFKRKTWEILKQRFKNCRKRTNVSEEIQMGNVSHIWDS